MTLVGWERLFKQRHYLIEYMINLQKMDDQTPSHDRFPLFRTAGTSKKPPVMCLHELCLDSCDKKLEVIQSFLLPDLIGIRAKNQTVKKKKVCNYAGFLVTEDEFEILAKLLGIFTAVELKSVQNIVELPPKWKSTTFMVI